MTSQNQSGPAPIDTSFLKDLADDPADLRELIELYLQQTRERIESLHKAIATVSAGEIMRLAHMCAGSSGMYGMTAIEPIFRDLEQKAKAGDLGQAPALFEKIRHEFKRIEAFWDQYQQEKRA